MQNGFHNLKLSSRIPMTRAALAILIVLSLTACERTQKESKNSHGPIPARVAEVVREDVPFFLEGIGNAAAFNTVDVKSRVTGELIKAFVRAGDSVRENQDLFTIDPEPFQAKVREGEAKVKQVKVQYEQAGREYLRFKTLYAEKAVSQEQLETKEVEMYSKLHQMELCQAELETAKLNLGYCFIRAPLEGQCGEVYIDDFNIVNANQDKLVTIKQIRPIKIKFSLPGKFLDELRKYASQGPMEVEASIPGNGKPETGSLSMIDNIVNPKTGMVGLEAIFPNPESRLWPGVFVRVKVRLTTTRDASLIPERAINQGPDGLYVWVVNQDQTVAIRPIELERKNADMGIISSGLKPGEKVITDGQLLLRPGAKVSFESAALPMKIESAGKKQRDEQDGGKGS